LRAIPRASAKNFARHPSRSVEGLAIRRPVLREARPRAARATTTRARRASFRFFKRLATWTLLGYTPWFFLNKTLDRTFCTSQLAEPFICEGDRNRRAPRRGDRPED